MHSIKMRKCRLLNNNERKAINFARKQAKKFNFAISYNQLEQELKVKNSLARKVMYNLVKKKKFIRLGTENFALFVLKNNEQKYKDKLKINN